MKYKFMIPLSAAGFLLACQPNDSLTGRTPPPGVNTKQSADSKTVDGAFVAPKDARNVALAPVAHSSAHVIVGTEEPVLMTFTCLDDASKMVSFSRSGAIRLSVGSQIIARQDPEEEIPGKAAEKPTPYINVNCKPGVDTPATTKPVQKPADAAKGAKKAPEAAPAPDMINTAAVVTGETPALAANIQMRELAPGYYSSFSALLSKDQKTATSLDISCLARESMDKASAFLSPESGVRPIDLVLGSGSQILLTTHLGTSIATSKFILVKCTP